MIQFYAPDIAVSGELPADEAAHCLRVLRHEVGDEIQVVDGHGGIYRCRIAEISRKGVRTEVLQHHEVRPHWGRKITLAVAPTKNADRMEWLMEKAVEMGVDRVTLLRCARSERREMRGERLRRIMVSAMKQSLKATLPQLEGPVDFMKFIESLEGRKASLYVAHCAPELPRRPLVCEPMDAPEIVMLIGPEGDFSPAEIEAALNAGFLAVSLGESRLRTETAALFSLAAIHCGIQRSQDRCLTTT